MRDVGILEKLLPNVRTAYLPAAVANRLLLKGSGVIISFGVHNIPSADARTWMYDSLDVSGELLWMGASAGIQTRPIMTAFYNGLFVSRIGTTPQAMSITFAAVDDA